MIKKTRNEEDEEFPDHTDWSQAKQGAKFPLPPGKERITIRIDEDVLAWFRSRVAETGGLYQTRINEALRAHMLSQSGELEEKLRKVVREELAAAAEQSKPSRTTTKRARAKRGQQAAHKSKPKRSA